MRYISLLRGINVSGQKKIRMIDLKAMYEKLGFQNVLTYIQSGNVIFDTDIKNRAGVKKQIEQAIRKRFGFDVPVELRTRRELSTIIKGCPFDSIDLDRNAARFLVTFLSSQPARSRFNAINEYAAASEKIVLKGTEIYLHCPDGYGKSRLSNAFLEQKLGVGATTRNWKSVLTLYELSGQD